MDLSGKDFSIQKERNAVREWILTHKPILVVGPDPGVTVRAGRKEEEAKERAKEHQKFMAEVILMQRKEGRKYYHEFPEEANSIKQGVVRSARSHLENHEVQTGNGGCREIPQGK